MHCAVGAGGDREQGDTERGGEQCARRGQRTCRVGSERNLPSAAATGRKPVMRLARQCIGIVSITTLLAKSAAFYAFALRYACRRYVYAVYRARSVTTPEGGTGLRS